MGATRTFLYATLPQIWPQVTRYSLYRRGDNIRTAAVLGVFGAGGLGQSLSSHRGRFQMHETCTVLIGMMVRWAGAEALFAQRAAASSVRVNWHRGEGPLK